MAQSGSQLTSAYDPKPDRRDVTGQITSSCRRLCTRVSPDHLRRLSYRAHEGAAHAVAIGKTRLTRDDIDGMAGLLHHQARGLDAQVLDRLGRRLAGLRAERTAELTRT